MPPGEQTPMKTCSLKERLHSGKPVFGAWLSIPSPVVAEVMALAGFDFLVIDTEHGAINVESVQTLIQAISATPVCPLVRLAENRSVLAGAVLDAGAAG